MRQKQHVYLGLGSNLKCPPRQLIAATKHISRLPNTSLLKMAPWYRTEPWGVTQQPDFLNTVLLIATALKPLQLLRYLKTIEYRLMARQAKQRWHSRSIDIDVLYYPNQPFKRSNLTLPHAHLAERCFVLRPLIDIKPSNLPSAVTAACPSLRQCCNNLTKQKNSLERHTIKRIIGIQSL